MRETELLTLTAANRRRQGKKYKSSVPETMSLEEGGTPVSDNRLIAAETTTYTEPSRTCNRRYSEVMREYLRRKRRRDGVTDDTNIKPSEVLTRQADHTGPNGCSYVTWDRPDTPGMLSLGTRQVPVVEDPCEVSNVQIVHCSPHLSPYSPVTSTYSPVAPESGTESFSTAKTHFSNSSTPPFPSSTYISFSKSSFQQLPPQANTDLAEGYFLPHDNTTSVGMHTFRPSDYHTPRGFKTPVIAVYSAKGSPKLTLRHNEDDFVQPKYMEDDEGRCLAVQPCESASRTFLVNANSSRTFRTDRHLVTFGEGSVKKDFSLLREAVHDSRENLLNPSALDFDQEFFISDLSQCHEEPIGMLSYPPDENDRTSYTLHQTSPQSSGTVGSAIFSWLPSTRQGSGRMLSQIAINDRLGKLKRLQKVGCGLVILSILLSLTAVLMYFILDE